MYSGITTNAAESLNNVIKSVQKRKQLPVDMINLTLFFLQKYIYTEIQCGRAGFGNYILKEEFSYAKIHPAEIQLSSFKGNPDSILQQANDQLDIFASSNCKTNEHLTTFPDNYCQNGNTDIHLIDKSDGLSDCFKDKNITTIDDKEEYERKGIEKNLSQKMLAEQVIHKDLIKYVSSMNAFMVEGIKGAKRVVTIKPKETCSCPSSGICYHILAVKMVLNLNNDCKTTSLKNVSVLKRNSRPRVAKKTGQKRSKKTDFEVNPAADSILCSTPTHNTIPPICYI